jgi:DNA polymerase-3 subunit gamma/tau
MSNFVVSARKYRPQKFDEVVGQEHVGQTLKNALKNDHLAHAFLFCGPRGVGKTTCARILAKVLNCQNKGDDFEPCNTCDSCQSFNGSSSFNIMELDAASNNSVEHIRTLVEQVRFQPQQGHYKIFIIDEVHMLSQSAFNAFLKTLEEPPPYAIFILATTEKHKIIPTILSRCQIFDFKRILIPNMVKHLQDICTQEGIEAEKDALHIIAQKADGALRDALSIFDRIVSFSGKKIIYEDVITNLNILDYEYYFRFTDALLFQDVSKVMLVFDEVLRNGFDGDLFINGLAEHFRDLLICKDVATLKLLEVSDSLKKRYHQQAQIVPNSFLLTALNLANNCDINYKMARNKRLHVEMCLIKMAYISQAVELSRNPQTVEEKKNPEPKLESPQPSTVEPNQKETLKSSNKEEEPTIHMVQEPEQPTLESSTPQEPTPAKAKATIEPPKNTSTPSELPKTSLSSLRNHSKLGTKKLMSLDELDDEIDEIDGQASNEGPKEITEEILQKTWEEYIDSVEQMTTKTILKSAEVKLVDGEIIIMVGSTLGENTVRQENNLMVFLREKLQNPKLVMKVEIDPEKALANNIPKRKKPMTDSEKYWKMKERNPLVDEMRKRFDLKFDQD